MVIFIGYRIINNSNIMFSTQLSTTNQQVSANDLNKFLSRDIQYSINIKGPIFSKYKEDGSQYTLYNIKNNEEVDYEYNITTNENEEISYIVSIKDGKYSISRIDGNEVSLDFIYNEKLIEEGNNLKAPLVIEQSLDNELLYYVNLESMNKKNNKYSFQVASRYQLDSINGGSNSENEGSSEDTDKSEGVISNKNLIFEYKKLDNVNYNWEHKVKLNLDEFKEASEIKANTYVFSDSFAIVRYGEYIKAYTSSWHSPNVELTKSIVKEIKGFRIKFEHGIKMKDVKFMNKHNYGNLNEINKEYIFKLTDDMENEEYGELLSGSVEIEENSKPGDIYTIEIEFIY